MSYVSGFPTSLQEAHTHCPLVDTVNAAPMLASCVLLTSIHYGTFLHILQVHSASRGRPSPGHEPSSLQRSALRKGLQDCLFWEEFQPAFPLPGQHWVFFQLMLWKAPHTPPSLWTTSHLPLLFSYYLPLPSTPHRSCADWLMARHVYQGIYQKIDWLFLSRTALSSPPQVCCL